MDPRRQHRLTGKVEKADQNRVKYFLDLKPGEKQFVKCSVTDKRRKVGPELNVERKQFSWRVFPSWPPT